MNHQPYTVLNSIVKRELLILLCILNVILLFPGKAYAQTKPFGGKAGISLSLGTHHQRIGIIFGAYMLNDFIQFNTELRQYYTFRAPGPDHKGPELQFSLGPLFSWGAMDSLPNLFFHRVSNQTGKAHSLGYAFNLYWDKKNTSQRTGTIGFQAGSFELIHENDVFGNLRSDRYRTSALLIAWRTHHLRLGLNMVLWTGNTNSANTRKVRDHSFARFGYIDMSRAEYGHLSCGLLGIQAEYAFPYHQTGSITLGIDDERVRNFLQNKLAHDSWFLPEKLNRARNYHIPMIDADGKMYLYKPGQHIRPRRLLLDVSLNAGDFY